MPKYEEIAGIIRNRISKGTYPVDTKLPIQSDLAEEFGVSRMTVKKAIEILTIEGLVFSKQGNGTKVLDSSFWDKSDAKFRLDNYNGLSKDLQDQAVNLSSQIVEFEVEFPKDTVAERLQLDLTAPVYKIVRLRLLDDIPYVIEHTFMPVDLVPGLDEEVLKSSIYDFLINQLGLKFAGSYKHITAEKPDNYDIDYLNCQENDPILQVEQVVYLENGRPIEYSWSRNRYDTRGYSLLDVKNI
ncbi:GntR family transcriptional regulator [Streptococcus macacae]|uniref:HTH-type transcriptional regulator GmuR n=1 Tax=Streptococcus macacae NCTC 11558 TaxID=764298 RepID=G5JXE2_9STRE|nr:GntR family transcriptional regulator [Streptococcus macacae]EHJ51933.1 HTH-type transcriptional regulator GmuR [Streptococcus macacae NCTC 11558]SUN79198.1 GentR family transcriptional regulator [Streptococcus macacae NCTC 11558]